MLLAALPCAWRTCPAISSVASSEEPKRHATAADFEELSEGNSNRTGQKSCTWAAGWHWGRTGDDLGSGLGLAMSILKTRDYLRHGISRGLIRKALGLALLGSGRRKTMEARLRDRAPETSMNNRWEYSIRLRIVNLLDTLRGASTIMESRRSVQLPRHLRLSAAGSLQALSRAATRFAGRRTRACLTQIPDRRIARTI